LGENDAWICIKFDLSNKLCEKHQLSGLSDWCLFFAISSPTTLKTDLFLQDSPRDVCRMFLRWQLLSCNVRRLTSRSECHCH
jgi:hypothetical protein